MLLVQIEAGGTAFEERARLVIMMITLWYLLRIHTL
jgi:hypothetical protein